MAEYEFRDVHLLRGVHFHRYPLPIVVNRDRTILDVDRDLERVHGRVIDLFTL